MQGLLFDIAAQPPKAEESRDGKWVEPVKPGDVTHVGPFSLETVYAEDCVEAMKKMPSNSVDVAIADPPYNLSKKREEIQFGKHPTQKPLRLLHRMLRLSAKERDVLLVPFAGAGSDCVAARELGIHFLAFETDPVFVQICRTRLGEKSLPDSQTVRSREIQERRRSLARGNPGSGIRMPGLYCDRR